MSASDLFINHWEEMGTALIVILLAWISKSIVNLYVELKTLSSKLDDFKNKLEDTEAEFNTLKKALKKLKK